MVGGLGDYLQNFHDQYIAQNYSRINDALRRMAQKDPMMAYVPAEGLGSNPDMLHFCAAAQREFGLRYYTAFKTLERPDKVFIEKPLPDCVVRGDLERL